jgi:hypothetical protein
VALARHGGPRTKAEVGQVDVIKLPPPSGKGGTGKDYLTARLDRNKLEKVLEESPKPFDRRWIFFLRRALLKIALSDF